MACLLCDMWARMPYAKRHTTPTSPQETEGALVVGYWLASRKAVDTVPRMCERHMNVINILDGQEERRLQLEQANAQAEEARALAARIAEPDASTLLRIKDLEGRKAAITGVQPLAPDPRTIVQRTNQVSHPGLATAIIQMPPIVQPAPNAPVQPATMFALGPGPLTNENQVTAPPPPPVPVPLSMDNSVIKTGLEPPPPPQPNARPPGPQEGAALIDAPCLFCKVMVYKGEVHNCPEAGARGN